MTILALGGLELGLQIGIGAGLWPGCRSPPSVSRAKALPPGIEPGRAQTQFLCDDLSRLPTAQPVADRLALEGSVEFPTDFNR